MATVQLEDVAEEVVRTVNNREWEAYGEFFAENVTMRIPGAIDGTTGREARIAFVQGIIRAFPDGKIASVRTIGQGDWSCFQLTFSGTHDGPLATPGGDEIPPTNKRVAFPYCVVARFEGDQIVELDEYFDQLELLTQLGLTS